MHQARYTKINPEKNNQPRLISIQLKNTKINNQTKNKSR